MTREQLAEACQAFDAAYPVGTRVVAHTGGLNDAGWQGEILEPGAWVLSGHTPVCNVSNIRGCVAISHIRPVKAVAD